jgi:rhamnosyltransferase
MNSDSFVIDTPKVVILLAAYNGVEHIFEQLNSIFFQKTRKIHVFVSVDSSDDDTYQYCLDIELLRNDITVLPYGEVFGGAAPNFFRLFRDVDFSEFDYVALADQDDIWSEDKLFTAITEISTRKVDAYSSNVTAFWPDGREHLVDKAQPQREFDYLFEAAGPGCTYVFNQDLAQKIQKFLIEKYNVDYFILHDWLFYAYARSHGYSWYIDSVPHMDYRQHHNNQVGVNNSFKSFWVRLKYVVFDDGLLQVKSLLRLLSDSNPQLKEWAPFGRKQIFNMLFKVNQFRRKPIERVYVFVALFIAFIVGVKDK